MYASKGKICSIKGCGARPHSHGWCARHHGRWKRHGDPEKTLRKLGENRSHHPLYSIYALMKGRCYNKNNKGYPSYGGRGIKVCNRWLGVDGFSNFLNDMGARPSKSSLDRINNNKGYSPSNCRWASHHVQAGNRRGNNKTVGVGWVTLAGKWRASLKIQGKTIYLGYFDSYRSAVAARREAEIKLKIK